MHSCTNLPLVLPGSPLLSPPQARHPPPTSTAATPLPRITPTHPIQLVPLRSQVIVLLWSRIRGWPRPARRSTHSRPRLELSPLPPLLLCETQLPVLVLMLCSSFLVTFGGWAGCAARHAACQAGLGCQSESEQLFSCRGQAAALRGCSLHPDVWTSTRKKDPKALA